MDIPFLDLKAQYKSIQKEIDQKILEVISSQKFILGTEVENFEKEIAAYSGAKYAVGVSSGSDALISSLMALEIKQGDAVVTTPFTFFATAGAISRLGARIVFCDIDRVTYNINPDNLEMLFKKGNHRHGNSRIKAIIPVHLYGQCADMTPILALAERYDLLVIEDAAQALGAEYPFPDGVKKASTIGDLGILSFFPSKNLGGYGDGGMVLTHKEDLALKLKLLRGHGSKNKYFNEIVGGNFRLDALQAAVLRIKLKYLDKWQQKRRENASYYNKLFKESGLVGENLIQLPEAVYRDSGVQDYHTYHQYVVRAYDRDDLKAFLKEKGVATAVYYPLPLHLQKCFADLGYRGGDFPESEMAASEVLALPIYPELTANQQEFLVTCTKKFYQRK